MASTSLFHQPRLDDEQHRHVMANYNPAQDIVVDPLLGVTYQDPLSTENPSGHPASQLPKSEWDQLDFDLSLINPASGTATHHPFTNQFSLPDFPDGQDANFMSVDGGQFVNNSFNNPGEDEEQDAEGEDQENGISSNNRSRSKSNSTLVERELRALGKSIASADSVATTSSEQTPVSSPQRKQPRTRRRVADVEESKRNKFLERNRQAASKCRQKKKEWVHDLEDTRAELESKNANLQEEYGQLLSQVTDMKNSLLDHASCNDPVITGWIDTEARKYVENTLKNQKSPRSGPSGSLQD